MRNKQNNNKKLSIGQLGCGYWGPNLVRNLTAIDQISKLTVCDTNAEMLKKAGTKFPGIETTHSPDIILNDTSIDAVVIALPAAMHYKYAKAALLKKKHILVEKPLATSVEEAKDLIQTAKDNKRILMVGHTFIFNMAVQQIKKYIDNGDLGDIYYIFSQRLNLGRVRQDVNAMWNLAPHDISIILYWLGEQPTKIKAKGQSFLQEGIDDLVFLHLDFPSGKSAHIHVTWLDPLKTRKIIVVGSRKMVVYDDVSTDRKIMVYDKGIDKTLQNNLKHEIYDYASFQLKNRVGDIIIPKIDFKEPLALECQHFIDCILIKEKPITDGISGLHVVDILEKAQKNLDKSL